MLLHYLFVCRCTKSQQNELLVLVFSSVYPHGAWTSATAVALSIITFAMSCLKMNADLFSADVSLSESFSGFRPVPDSGDAYYALFNYEDVFHEKDDEFPRYSSEQLDDMGAGLKVARVFAIVGISLIFLATVVILAVPCVVYKPFVLNVCGVMLLLGSVCEALTFTIFSSNVCQDYNCDICWGCSSIAMISSFFALVTGVLVFFINKHPEESPSTPEIQPESAQGEAKNKTLSDEEAGADAVVE